MEHAWTPLMTLSLGLAGFLAHTEGSSGLDPISIAFSSAAGMER